MSIDQTSVYGGSTTSTTNDGADSIYFAVGATQSFIQSNAGADTLHLKGGSKQSTVKAGAGNDSIKIEGGGSQLYVYGNNGDDTLNWGTATSVNSTLMQVRVTTTSKATAALSGSSSVWVVTPLTPSLLPPTPVSTTQKAALTPCTSL